MADPNTRQGKRTPVTLKIKFKSETLEQFIERYAVDVSQGGIFIRTKEPLPVGTQMRFEFQLRDASPLIGGEGTVVWTRENDPSRPAIAPGMGVRFDRLAEGSQSVLERILAEKAKQAPQRPAESVKPPMFTDIPTRVAPPPIQESLQGQDSRRNKRTSNEPFVDQQTPLPKPMPFHSDADEFPEEAFEEATKVRALDDLIAQTSSPEGDAAAVGTSTEQDLFGTRGAIPGGLDELAARRNRADSTVSDDAPTHAAPAGGTPTNPTAPTVPSTLDPSSTSPGFASGRSSERSLEKLAGGMAPLDRDSAPNLPSPPIVENRSGPARLLDTTPSPRTESATAAAMEGMMKTKIGMEPVLVPTRPASMPSRTADASTPPTNEKTPASDDKSAVPVARDAPTRPSGIQASASASASEPTAAVRVPKKSSLVPILVLVFVLLAASGAAVWFFVLRDKAQSNNVANNDNPGSGSGSANVTVGSNGSADGSGSGSGSAVAVHDGSGSAEEPPVPKGPPVEIVITSTTPKATVEIVGTDMKGPAPFKAKLDRDQPYKVRISAPGFATLEKDITGGTAKLPITLEPKPRALDVKSEPSGALIIVDGRVIPSKLTPQVIDLEPAQAAKKAIRVGFRLTGYRSVDRMVDASAFTENDDKLVASVTAKLERLPVVVRPPRPPVGSGSANTSGSGSDTENGSNVEPTNGGSATPPAGSGSGSAKPVGSGSGSAKPAGSGSGSAKPAGSGSGSAAPPPPPPTGSGGGEPTPDFIKNDAQP